MCDVSCEVSILVALFIVPSVNIPLSRTCELIKVDGFHVVVNNHNVLLLLFIIIMIVKISARDFPDWPILS